MKVGDLGSIPGRVIPKNLKMVLYTSLLNTQQYKVRIKGKVLQSREKNIEKGAFGSPPTKVANFTYNLYCISNEKNQLSGSKIILMTFIRWSLIHLCFEYDVETPSLFPAWREKNFL